MKVGEGNRNKARQNRAGAQKFTPRSKFPSKKKKNAKAYKARVKAREDQWKNQMLLQSVLQLLGDPEFNNADNENDLLYFQDLDLAIFGASPGEYKLYANQLQKEYVHMDDSTYKNMRLKILQTFLTIPNIYSTESFRDKFEKMARANIDNEILELKK